MLKFQDKYKHDLHSQNGENGLIAECIKRIKPKVLTACEFGAPSFTYCSNVAFLADEGWEVKMFDINPNADTRIKQEFIRSDNVSQVIGEPTILSIDIDGDDYNVWQAYTFRPDIVIIEVNSSILPPEEVVPGDRGASYMSMVKLGISKDYFLLAHTGNCIFVLNKFRHLFPEVECDGVTNWTKYFNRSHL